MGWALLADSMLKMARDAELETTCKDAILGYLLSHEVNRGKELKNNRVIS
jgi:hypothetical protein